MGKRLYEMTVRELEAEAARYEQIGNEMCEQIGLNFRIAEAFTPTIKQEVSKNEHE